MTPTERAELRRMGERLIALAEGNPDGVAETDHDPLLDAAWREISRRKSRKRAVPSELLGEPAWDILLDLFVMLPIGRPVSVTSACIASNSPPTTGLRWVHALVDGGYIVREPDPSDARRSFVRLSNLGTTIIAEALRNSMRAEQLTIETHCRRLLGENYSDKGIANLLGMSAATVETHLAHMRSEREIEQARG